MRSAQMVPTAILSGIHAFFMADTEAARRFSNSQIKDIFSHTQRDVVVVVDVVVLHFVVGLLSMVW